MGAYEELAVYKSARTLLAKLTMVFINAPNAYRKTVCVMMYKRRSRNDRYPPCE